MRKLWLFVLSLCLVISLSGCSVKSEKTYIHQLTNQTDSQMMSYVITDADGTCIVFDGGTSGDRDYLINYIRMKDDDATVDAWFITHYHKDHTGALASYLSDNSGEITIRQIYCALPSESDVLAYDSTRIEDYRAIKNALASQSNVIYVSEGMMVSFKTLHIQAINSMQTFTNNFGNNTSICYKVTDLLNDSTFLILGDTGEELSNYLLENKKDEISNMDFVQMAHHGQAGATQALYQAIHPKACLWPLTDWIYTNENGQGSLRFDETKGWIDEIGVEKNYYAMDGTSDILF